MLVAGKYEFPDKCPEDCGLKDDLPSFGQNSICTRCPVFNCGDSDSPPLVSGEGYREDWAKEWKRFFDGEVDCPRLTFEEG